MDTSADFALALLLQEESYRENDVVVVPDNIGSFGIEGPGKSNNDCTKAGFNGSSLCDETWELVDPNPDAWALFIEFNKKFFWDKLTGVELRWSPRMTLCAGLCEYEGRGGLCCIKLSEPLLKLRPRKDLVETLLHEMIHAYLFVTNNDRDREGHGPEFLKHMHRLNAETGAKISVYHTFNDEVDLYRVHWWRCNGPCRDRRPYFGYVKRSMNRPPSSRDPWFSDHQRTCGGVFTKIKEPEGYGVKKTTSTDKGKGIVKSKPPNTIDKWCNNDKKNTTGLVGATKPQLNRVLPVATLSKPPDIDDFSFDAMSDDELVSAVSKVEEKLDDRFKSEDKKVSLGSVSEFPGQGYVLGTSYRRSDEAAAMGSIVRRIPGIGVVRGRSIVVSNGDGGGFKNKPTVFLEPKLDTPKMQPHAIVIDKVDKVTERSADVTCDLSDSDDDFDKLLASHRLRFMRSDRLKKKKKVIASEFTAKVFGNVAPERGSIICVKDFVSVSNLQATRSHSKKDRFLEVRTNVANADDDDDDVEMRPMKRHRPDTGADEADKDSNGLATNSVRSVSAAIGSIAATAPVVLIDEDEDSPLLPGSPSRHNYKPIASPSTSAHQSAIPMDAASVIERSSPVATEPDVNALVQCPICMFTIEAMLINFHLDECLSL